MNVVFDEAPIAVITNDHRGQGGFAGFLLRHHIVKTLTQAHITLLTFSIIIFISAGVLARIATRSEPIDTRTHFVPAVPTR